MAEGVFIGIQQQPDAHAPLLSGYQGFDDRAVGEVEHGHVEAFPGLALVNHRQGLVPDGGFGEYLNAAAGFLVFAGHGLQCVDPTVNCGGICAGHLHNRAFAANHIGDCRAIEGQGGVAVPAAAIVGVGGGDHSTEAISLVGNQYLAMVGLEVGQGQVAANGGGLRAQCVWQPATIGVVAQPLAAEPP